MVLLGNFSPPQPERPANFCSQIAAAGIKPNVQQAPKSTPHPSHEHDTDSAVRDGAVAPSHLNGTVPASALKTKSMSATKDNNGNADPTTNGSEVRVQVVDSTMPRDGAPLSEESSRRPVSDDVRTHVSSSSDSNKPPSTDGKSVASGTTFNALDERDSLRPDDSASVKAVEDEEPYSAPGSGLPSRIGSDDGVRAFRDQLREISSMDPSRRGAPPPDYTSAAKGVLYVPPQGPGIGAVPSPVRPDISATNAVEYPPDQKLLEALENPRDRVWVLKLEQDVIDFVKDAKESSLTLPQCHSFYRLLAHKMADYYMLGHLIDDTSAAVRLYKTPHCRIPPPLTGITAPSTAASTPPPVAPAMKILRRGDKDGPAIANGSYQPSKGTSENGESGDEKKKPPATREEREARYEAARLRIMGSAKPVESPETPKEKQESRSSSAAGKKNKKKARADDDDGFEARSAYSNYYATPFGSDGVHTPNYGYPEANDPSMNQYQNPYPQSMQGGQYGQMPMPAGGNHAWNQQPYHSVDPTHAWAQGQLGAYDLPSEFQRMSFQQQIPSQHPSMGQGPSYAHNYGQQYYAPQQGWQQPPQASMQAPSSAYGYGPPNMPPQMFDPQQPYQFGQLPSQAFPGRVPNKNEHPLPGSYKGKNFNPQSQTFIPGQTNGSPVTPQGVPSLPSSVAQPYMAQSPAQPHSSTQSQSSSFSSPHQHGTPSQTRISSQPLTHPLPQGPVFPRQPSPNVPLPPKPGTMSLPPPPPPPPPPPHHQQQQQQHQQPQLMTANPLAMPQQSNQKQTLIAKWGAPPSLPAKPPTSGPAFDGANVAYRQPFGTPVGGPAARQPVPGYPPYGPSLATTHVVNGMGMPKRS
jgi:hypothetical protein